MTKGVLLYGMPGVGKTFLIRALANEIGIPFYPVVAGEVKYTSGSTECKTLKEVFDIAGASAPSVVLIDEIDSFIESQSYRGQNDVLYNQLLTLLDGFEQHNKVIVIAATNNIKKVPAALMRPGRFDRRIEIDLPSDKAREEALKKYFNACTLAPDFSFEKVTNLLEYATMAEIKHVANETIIHAIKHQDEITEEHVINAYDRHQMGIIKKDDRRSEGQIMRVAFHEAGHAVANYHLNDVDTIARVSVAKQNVIEGHIRIINRNQIVYTEHELKNRVITSLAGYATELLIYGEVSAGSANDIALATRIAKDMVYEYGMSKLGPVKFKDHEGIMEASYSDNLESKLEIEVMEIVTTGFKKAQEIVGMYREKIELIANHLFEKKVLSTSEVKELLLED